MLRTMIAILVCALASGASAEVLLQETGALTSESEMLDSGEFVDVYTLEVPAGVAGRVTLMGEGCDPYLIVQLPDGSVLQNDDFSGTDAQVCFFCEEAGEVAVAVTTAAPGEQGQYLVRVEATDSPEMTALLETPGSLGPGSDSLETGEYMEAFAVPVESGEMVRARLASAEFDAYLLVATPGGVILENDDREGTDSEIALVASQAGDLTVIVTTLEPGEQGRFRLVVQSSPWDVEASVDRPAVPTAETDPPLSEAEGVPPPADIDLVALGNQPANPADPALRMPRAKPNPASVADPGILADTLHQMTHVSVDVFGLHDYVETSARETPDGPEPVDLSDEWPQTHSIAINTFHYPNFTYGGVLDAQPLEWAGNTFWSYKVFEGDDYQYAVDVTGVVSPDGNRLEWLAIRSFFQEVDPDDGDDDPTTGLLKHRIMQDIAVVDVPLDTAFGYDPQGSLQEALRGDSIDRILDYGFHYRVADDPAAADHVARMGYLRQWPAKNGARFIEPGYMRLLSYKDTQWLSAEHKPSVVVSFERLY
jgi:hypothetical protein